MRVVFQLVIVVEMRRVELLTSALRTQRSAKLSYIPMGRSLEFRVSGFKVSVRNLTQRTQRALRKLRKI